MAARTKMVIAISKLLFEQGILYTLPPVKRADRAVDQDIPDAEGTQDMGLVGQMATYSMMPQVTQLGTWARYCVDELLDLQFMFKTESLLASMCTVKANQSGLSVIKSYCPVS